MRVVLGSGVAWGGKRGPLSPNCLLDNPQENVKSVEKVVGGGVYVHMAWSDESTWSPIVNL